MIPNLIIPGAPKSGTSSLHEYLNLHPNIEMSRVKEPHYFTNNERYNLGLGFYKNLFLDNYVRYHGESSTAYFSDELSIARIEKDLKDVKFIVILRDPVERTISHYLWQVSLLQEFRILRKAVEYNIKNPIDYRKPGWGGHFKSYYSSSLYGKNIRRLINNFGQENIHVITTKELSEDVNNCINSCFNFLELENFNINSVIQSNKTKKIRSIKRLLRMFIGKSIKRGVIDFRLFYHAIRPSIGKITAEDKNWLRKLFKEDTNLLKSYYPDIEQRW